MVQRYTVSIGNYSVCSVKLCGRDSTAVVLPSDDTSSLVLEDGDFLHLTVKDSRASMAYALKLDGLVSDRQMTNLSGELVLSVSTEAAALNVPANLAAGDGSILNLETAAIDLRVVRNLACREAVSMSLMGSVSVHKEFAGTDSNLSVGTSQAKISAVVLSVLSDWADDMLAEVVEKPLDDLVYKEV